MLFPSQAARLQGTADGTPLPAAVEPGQDEQAPSPLDGAVLSATGGRYAASPEVQRMLVFTTNGLFVSPQHQGDLHVLSYIERLRQNRVPFVQHEATIDEITAAYLRYKRSDAGRIAIKDTGGDANSDEQRRVIDLMVQGLKEDTSDVHFIVSKDRTDVKFRILGELETKHGYTRQVGMKLVSSVYTSMCDVASQNFNASTSQDARLKAEYTEALGLYGARVATRPTHDGLLMVLRLLKSDDRIMTHAELGLLPQQVELIERMASRPYGVSLISGPTGSGKSRTLQATMARILARERNRIHLITVEDPPEYPIPGAVVTPLKVRDRSDPDEVSRAWREAISNAVRLDPDVVMVGEVRDRDSADTVFAAAMTGHPVFGSLHANDATSVAERLIDMRVEAAKVTDPQLMVGLIAQRLLPVLCPDCKIALSIGKTRLPPATLARLVRITPPELLARVYVRGDGCAKCKQRGIVARRPVVEAIVPNLKFMEEFRSSPADGKLRARRYWMEHLGGITMLRHALHLVWQGLVDPLTAEDVAELDNDLHMLGVDYAVARELV